MNNYFHTSLCKKLGIDYPIFQGGMAWVATGELAGAVSQAGGLGIIGAGNAPPKIVSREIEKVREITEKPFGINIMLLSPWVEEVVDLVLRKEVPVVTTGAGNPGKYIEKLRAAGIHVIPVVSSCALARRLSRLDITAVIAEGNEAGGHVGRLGSMALLPQIADSIDLPVIAAGGIADARGFLAAFNLGAEAVQMGTRFVCSEECTADEAFKEAIIGARDRDAVVTGRSTGHPVRTIKNKLTRKIHTLEEEGADSEEIEKLAEGSLRRAAREGDIEKGSVMAGQISGMISNIRPAREIIEDILQRAEAIIDRQCNTFQEGKR